MRDLTTDQQTAVEATVVRPVLLCRLDFESGAVLVHSAVGTITYNTEDYLGVGHFGGISEIKEGSDSRPNDIDLSLSGIPAEYIAKTLGENYQGRAASIAIALLDADHQIISGVKEIWAGYMDTPDIKIGATATISVHCRSRANDWDKSRVERYTMEQQRADYPDDSGLDYVAQMAEKSIQWGRA